MIQKSIYILFFLIGFTSCKKEVTKEADVEKTVQVSSVKTYNYNELKPFLEKKDENIYIVNFWATWCAPCVKELPYFEKIKQDYASKNVEVLLVSLDFPKQVNKKLIPFINKHQIQSEVVLLDDVNEDFWIKAIDESWSGALPATIIYSKNNRKFYEQSFDYKTLERELLTFINKKL
jgi:thiol-disulfide isomerase/thioredoxin